MGKKMGVKVIAPLLVASGATKTTMPLVRKFINNHLFDVYVRIMAHTRYFLSLSGCEVKTLGFDARMRENLYVKTGIDVDLPFNMKWKPTSPAFDVVSHCFHMSKTVCKHLNVSTVPSGCSESESESSESESSSESSLEELLNF